MALHVIIGAGAVGSATATLLAERGDRVRIISRSGSGPEHPAIERVKADATDAQRLTELATGAAALHNCANPLYHRWLTDWAPLGAAMLTAAERTGAVLTITGNLYPYGPVTGPMTESTPLAATHPKLKLRGDMWLEALALHEAGRIRVTEVRGSDYLEANGILTFMLAKPLLAGKRAWSPAPLDVPHTWTATADVARMMVTVSTDERAWGKVWHVPSNPPLTVRQLAERFTRVHGAPDPKLTAIPYPVLWGVGVVNPFVRELRATRYQFTAPYILDSTSAQDTFGIGPTDLDVILKQVHG